MNAFAKRALILTLLVLCLFGITILGASAASNTGYATDAEALAADSTFVARVGDVGTSATYYTSVADAVKAAGSTETTIYVLADFTIGNNNYVTLGDTSDDIVLHQSIILKGVDLDGDGKYPTINGSRNRNFVNYDASDLTFENLNIIGNGRLIQHYNGGSADNHNKLIFGDNVHVNVTPTGGEDWIHASTSYFDFTLAESASITATYTSRGQKQNLFTVSGANSVLNIYGDIAMTASNITDTTHQTYIINGTPTVNIYETANITFNADTSQYMVAPFSGVGTMCFEGTYNGVALTDTTASAIGLKVFVANPDNTVFATDRISNAYFEKAQDNATFYVLADAAITTGNDGISKTVKITSKAGGTYKLTTSSYAFFTLCEGGNLTLENIELSYTGGSGSGRFARIDGSSNITLGAGTTVSTTAAIFIYSNGQNANSDVFYTFDIQSGATVNWNYATAADFIYHNANLYSGKNNHVKGEIIVNGTLNFGTVAHTLVNDKNTNGAYNGYYILRVKPEYLSIPTVNPNGAIYLSGYETLDAADAAAKTLGLKVRLGNTLDANGGALYANYPSQAIIDQAQSGDTIYVLENVTQPAIATLGSSASKDGSTGKSLTIAGVNKDVVWTMGAGNTFYLYDGSDLTFTNMKMVIKNRLIHGGDSVTTSATNTTKVVFGDNLTVTGTTGAETVVHIPGGSYWDIDVNETATFNMTYTGLLAANVKDTDSRRVIFEYSNVHGTVNLRGTITMTGTAAEGTPGTPHINKHFSVIYAGTATANAKINIYSTAAITYSKPESFVEAYGWTMIASCVPVYFPDALANYFAEGETASHAALANRYQLDVMVVDANGGMFGTYNYADRAFSDAASGSTITFLDDAVLSASQQIANKTLTVTATTPANTLTTTVSTPFVLTNTTLNINSVTFNVTATDHFMVLRGNNVLNISGTTAAPTVWTATTTRMITVQTPANATDKVNITGVVTINTSYKLFCNDSNSLLGKFEATIDGDDPLTTDTVEVFTASGGNLIDTSFGTTGQISYTIKNANLTASSAVFVLGSTNPAETETLTIKLDNVTVNYTGTNAIFSFTDSHVATTNIQIKDSTLTSSKHGFRIVGASTNLIDIDLENVTMTTSDINFYVIGTKDATATNNPALGHANLDIDIDGGSYTGKGIFCLGHINSSGNWPLATDAKINITVDGTAAKHIQMEATGSGDIYGILMVGALGNDPDLIKLTMNYVDAEVAGYAIRLNSTSPATVDFTNGSMATANTQILTSNTNCIWKATFTNVDIAINKPSALNYAFRPYGVAGSTIDIIGGSITVISPDSALTASSPPKGVFGIGNSLAVTITGTVINSAVADLPFIYHFADTTSAVLKDVVFEQIGQKLTSSDACTTVYNAICASDAAAIAMGLPIRVGDSVKLGGDGVYKDYITGYYAKFNAMAVNMGASSAYTAYVIADVALNGEATLGTNGVTGDTQPDNLDFRQQLTIIGVDTDGDGTYPLVTHTSNRGFDLFNCSTLTIENLNLRSNSRLVQARDHGTKDVHSSVTIGDNVIVTMPSRLGPDDWINAGVSYFECTVNESASITYTSTTGVNGTQGQCTLFLLSGENVTLTLKGDISMTVNNEWNQGKTGVDPIQVPVRIAYVGASTATLNIYSTCSISFSVGTKTVDSVEYPLLHTTKPFGGYAKCYLPDTDIENLNTVAERCGLKLRVTTKTEDFFINELDDTLVQTLDATGGITLTLTNDLHMATFWLKFPDGTDVLFTSGGSKVHTLLNSNGTKSDSGLLHVIGGNFTFENIKLELSERLARLDNDCSFTFGDGAIVNCTGDIFFYRNDNTVKPSILVTFDFQDGSEITFSTDNYLIYQTGAAKDWDGDGTTESTGDDRPKFNVIIHVAGKMNLSSDNSGTIFYDNGGQSEAIIYYYAETAEITSVGARWFYQGDHFSTLYLIGFETVAEADAFAIAHAGAGARSGAIGQNGEVLVNGALTNLIIDLSDTSTNVSTVAPTINGLAYSFFRAQLDQVMVDVLPETGGAIHILKTNSATTGIWATIHFNTEGKITVTAEEGVVVTNQGSLRMRIKTDVTFQNINFAFPAGKAIEISLGGKATLNGCTVTVTAGNNADSPFTFLNDGYDNKLEMYDCTLTNASGDFAIIATSGGAAAKAEILLDNTTVTVSDTLIDYRNTNANSNIKLTVENSTLTFGTGIYANATNGHLDVTFKNSTSTAGSFITMDGAGAPSIKLNIEGTKDPSGNYKTVINGANVLNITATGTGLTSIEVNINCAQINVTERVLNIKSLAPAAEGKGFKDAAGNGNYAAKITVEDINVVSCHYFFIPQGSKGDILFVMNGTKTGMGANATHTNNVHVVHTAFYLQHAGGTVDMDVSGLKITGYNMFHFSHTSAAEEGVNATFTDLTVDITNRLSDGKNGATDPDSVYGDINLTFADSSVTPGDASTYSNEFSYGALGFLWRKGFKNWNISFTGCQFNGPASGSYIMGFQSGAKFDVDFNYCVINDTLFGSNGDFASTTADVDIQNTTLSSKGLTASVANKCFDLTLTDCRVITTGMTAFRVSADTTAKAIRTTFVSSLGEFTALNETFGGGLAAHDLSQHTTDLNTADRYAVILGFTVRLSNELPLYHVALDQSAVNHATENATKQGILYVLVDITSGRFTLGDGVDNKDIYTPYDVIIVGVNNILGKQPTITASTTDGILLYDGSNLEFRNVTITSGTRWIRIYNTKGNNANAVDLIFGDNVNIKCPSGTGTEDFIYSQGGSYVNMTFAPTSTITAKYTGIKPAADATSVTKRLIALNNSYGIFALNGRIDVEFNGAHESAKFMMVYQTSFSGDVVIGDTAVINYTTTGTYASSIPFNVTGHMLIKAGALYNGAHLDDATALELGFTVRNTNTKGEVCFYSSGLFRSTYLESASYSTYTLLADAKVSVYERIIDRNFVITSVAGSKYTLTLTGSYGAFCFGKNSSLTLTNVTLDMGTPDSSNARRFARIDGDTEITFGEGSTVNCAAGIFIYNNGNNPDAQITTAVFRFEEGSVVNWTSTSGNLIYHNGSKDWNGDGTDEKTIMNAVIYISGELNLSTTTTGTITNDKEDSSDYFVYIDASTAKINSAGSRWFYHSEAGSVVYITGFETLAEADAFAISGGLGIRSGAKIGEGIWIPYTSVRGQIHQTAIDVLPEGEDTIYIIANVNSVYATLHFQNRETIKVISAKPDGTMAKLGNQGSTRFRIKTNVIFEGLNVALSTGPNIEVSLGGTLTMKDCAVTGTGNLTTPMSCLVDGNVNTIVFENTTITTVLENPTLLNCTIVGHTVSDLGAIATLEEADAVARAIGLVARVSDDKPIYAFGLNMVAVDYATNNANGSGTIYLLGNVTLSTQHQLTLGDNTDAYKSVSLVIQGINIGTTDAPAYPTITQTYGNRVISIYDGSDIAFYNVNFEAISRIIQVYAGSTEENHTKIYFGEGFKMYNSGNKQSAESFMHVANCYADVIFAEGSEFVLDVTVSADTAATRRVLLDYVNLLGGELVIAGKLHYHVTDNNADFADEFIMLKTSGNAIVKLHKSASFDFYADASANEGKIVKCLYMMLPVFLYDFTAEESQNACEEFGMTVMAIAPDGYAVISDALSGLTKHIASGSVIYLYSDISDYNIPVTKQLTIKSYGENVFTIKNSSAGTSLFVFNGGSAEAPAKLLLENVKIDAGTNTAYIFDFCGTSYTIIDVKNVEADYQTGLMGVVRENANVFMTMEDVTITAKGGFTIKEDTVFELTAKEVDLTTTGAGDAYTVFHLTCTSGTPVKITIEDSAIKTEGAAHGFYAMNPTYLQLKLDNVSMDVQHWAISSQANTRLEIDMIDCYVITQTRRHVLRVYGVSGSFMNISNSTIISKAPYESSYTAAIAAGTMLTLNIYGGYFESADSAVVTALTSTVTINIYGGTFNYAGNLAGTSPIHVDAGTVNVYGGNFYTKTTVAPVFNNTNSATNTMNLYSLVANGYTNLITNMGAGTPTSAHTTSYGHTTMNGLKMTNGATPDFVAGGMKFMVTLSATAYQQILSIADDGETEVAFGMMFLTADKALAAGKNISHYTLSESDYINVLADTANVTVESDGCVTVTVTLTTDKMESLSTVYGAVAFAKYQVNGYDVYMYSNYDAAKNSRSLEQIARSAYNDRTSYTNDIYANLVSEGSYSRYTADQLTQLATWCNNDTDQKVMDIYLVAGGSNAAGNTSFNEKFADAIKTADKLSSNVFYSGIVADHGTQSFKLGEHYSVASKYTTSGSLVAPGYGWLADTIGPELGMAQALSAQYNATSGKYAAIIKYAFNGSNLADILEGNDEFSGNWASAGEEAAGEKTGALFTEYMNLVAYEIRNYVEQGYKVNIVGMYWLQGEDDIAAAATTNYANLFAQLVANVRNTLTGIYSNETGTNADFSAMPVAVGEVANFLVSGIDSKYNDFVTLQNTLTANTGVHVVQNSQFPADENGIFINPDDMVLVGELAAAKLMQTGTTALPEGTEIATPVVTPAAEVLDADGNPITAFRSLVMAAALAPNGSTLKLVGDQTAYTTLSFQNTKNITIDGDGHTITFQSEKNGIEFIGATATLNNIELIHTSEDPAVYAIYGDKNSNITLSGESTKVEAETTAIMMAGANSNLVIKDGTYTNRTAEYTDDAIIFTTKANVAIEGGHFEAVAGAACVYVDYDTPNKLTINVKGGTFITTDVIDRPVLDENGEQLIDADTEEPVTENVYAPAFVNNSYVAILVVAPEVVLDCESIEVINNGFGTPTTEPVTE